MPTETSDYGSPLIGFEDRGDPAMPDFEVGDLTTDGAYHDLDLSAIVPPGATAVALRIRVQDDAAGSTVVFRENGNSNVYNLSQVVCNVANIYNAGDVIVALDSNQTIEYWATNTTWTVLDITVKGWFYSQV